MKRRNRPKPSTSSPNPGPNSIATIRALEPRDWLFIVALLAAVILVYQPAWHGGFLWDDDAHVTRPELRSWHGLYRIWFDVGATLQYYPVLHSAFWIEHKLWGDAPLGYHLLNVLLHATAALMAALILRRLKIPGAYLAAAIFALHPIQAESVAWITEQKNTLSALFYLGAMLACLRFDQTRKTSLYCWALALFVLGILTKTVIATMPGALLVIFWWQRGRLSWKNDLLPLVPFFLLGAGAGMITAWWELQINQCVGPDFTLTVVERCLIAGRTAWFLLWKLFWPTHLTFIYPRWQINSGIWWQYAFLLGAALLLAVLWLIRRWVRAPLAAVLFFGGTLFPTLGFFNLYTFLYSFVANHYQYLAGLGIITLVAAGAALTLTRWRLWNRPGGYAACLVLLAILAGLTRQQSQMYADADTLFSTTIRENPRCWMARCCLGNVLLNRGQTDEAISLFQQTLEIKPDYAAAHYNLGLALAMRGRSDEAIAHCQEALKIKPDYAEAHNNLGVVLAMTGRVDEAIVHYQQALDAKPDYAEAHNNLGGCLARVGRVDDAILHYQQALAARPGYANARDNLDVVRSQREGMAKALAERRELLRAHPDDVALLNETAWVLATNPNASIRNGVEAVELARRALQLSDGREPAVLGTLAAACAEAGRFSEAVDAAQQALSLATGQNNTTLADQLRARIKLYKNHSPYREMPQQAVSHSDHP